MLDLSRLAWDLSLFTAGEFGFVKLPAQYTTGSSIMPNKRNPDVIELMRATYASVAAARCEIEQLLSLPSGYHRDLQLSKGALFHGFGKGLQALALLPDLLRNLDWNTDRMRAALEPSMYATDLAVDMARAGVPFRDAYRAAADPARWAEGDPAAPGRAGIAGGRGSPVPGGIARAVASTPMSIAPRKRRTRATARPLSLALQGGGAHGAFTWGVLDALLEDGRFDLCGASGTSAGAMNAVVLAHGLLVGGRDGAREALSRFWSAVGGNASLLHVGAGASDGRPSPMASLMLQWSGFLAPAQFNPMGYDPLRDIVEAQVDFERLRAEPGFDLFIAATHANTGRLRLFRTAEISADAVLASACLPALYQAVEIDGEPYWDGAFAANPPAAAARRVQGDETC